MQELPLTQSELLFWFGFLPLLQWDLAFSLYLLLLVPQLVRFPGKTSVVAEEAFCIHTSLIWRTMLYSHNIQFLTYFLHFPNPDIPSVRTCMHTPHAHLKEVFSPLFLRIFLAFPPRVSQWGDWQQQWSTAPDKTVPCLFFPQPMLLSCFLSSVSPAKAQGKLQAPCAANSPFLQKMSLSSPSPGKESSPLTNLWTFILQILAD